MLMDTRVCSQLAVAFRLCSINTMHSLDHLFALIHSLCVGCPTPLTYLHPLFTSFHQFSVFLSSSTNHWSSSLKNSAGCDVSNFLSKSQRRHMLMLSFCRH